MVHQLFNNYHKRDLLANDRIVGFEKKVMDLLVKKLHFVLSFLCCQYSLVKQNFLH